ncbi:hypothetical protein Kpol_1045p79 [Vanderwaltozyma polyspora DSM 70294]|uniref:Uncharacterized protein n=1 Tax=Vanderwaltozyma polyspora (strain ATCC 22028 / DSM 70294 / BCRC 21397 / CBS 2163 / NBRC 10782 / NRRL Y-8283 / UCD 57-17) TaxID=436907 RepID=A7TI85_VANPO|nr:uncharacterized protein Kpol_1045p79 [Vanderwaltozyma polyspora DSM 70294]EDO18092.1 hypothetical protein Kpol_1045p79 [Vanderwaltozyma polyspora DSM 70294]
MTSFRQLGTYEKKLVGQALAGQSNGIIFSAKYISNAQDGLTDDATLLTNSEPLLLDSRLVNALQKMVLKHPELRTTVNEKLEFEEVKEIKTSDIITSVKFDSLKDEFVNCHLGAPPYLLRHIFNRNKFTPGSGKPLWELCVIDDSLVMFHGQDVLFDIFAAANFHKLFLETLNSMDDEHITDLEYIYRYDATKSNRSISFPRTIYENPKLRIPGKTIDLVNLQTQSFFKSFYVNAIKKPLDIITFNSEPMKYIKPNEIDFMNEASALCGTTVFGHITTDRFEYLNSIARHENVCIRSFICGIALLCLKSMIKDFTGSITFSIPVNLRESIEGPSDFGLFYKTILVECPLSLIDDQVYNNINVYNGYDNSNVKVPETDPTFEEKKLEYQFKQISDLVSTTMKERMRAWRRNGFNDDDIKKMKFTSDDKASNTKIIQINDVSEFKINSSKSSKVSIKELNFTHSISNSDFMSLSYTYCKETGSNICIHYPDAYDMEKFVERFQSFVADQQ